MSGDVGANTAGIVTTAIAAAVQLLQAHHAAANPTAPPLTDQQALAALQDAVKASLARDAQLRDGIASAAQLGVPTGSTGE